MCEQLQKLSESMEQVDGFLNLDNSRSWGNSRRLVKIDDMGSLVEEIYDNVVDGATSEQAGEIIEKLEKLEEGATSEQAGDITEKLDTLESRIDEVESNIYERFDGLEEMISERLGLMNDNIGNIFNWLADHHTDKIFSMTRALGEDMEIMDEKINTIVSKAPVVIQYP